MSRFALFAVMVVACSRGPAETLTVADQPRAYDVFAPSNAPGMPLVIVLHGGGSNGAQTRRLTHFDELATRERFVVVYPEGVAHHWNDGRDSVATGADDVAFIRSLIDEMAQRYAIDRKRVYVTGISNGGMMSYRLACDLSDQIAAIAPVAGELPQNVACTPKVPISVLAINGTADPIVPYNGGEVIRDRGAVLGADASTATFARAFGCGVERTSEDLPDRDADDTTTSQLTSYRGCPAGVAVELLTVENGGHTWPGGPQYLPKFVIGATSRDFDATETIWKFFAAHPRP